MARHYSTFIVSNIANTVLYVIITKDYRVGQIKRGQLTFLLVTSERIYKIK